MNIFSIFRKRKATLSEMTPDAILTLTQEAVPEFLKSSAGFKESRDFLAHHEWELALDCLLEMAEESGYSFTADFWNNLAISAEKMQLVQQAEYCRQQIIGNESDPILHGAIDDQGRCRHYHSDRDIIAIKFKCCQQWYACIHCHDELAGHTPEQWLKEEFSTAAIMCGNCHSPLSITVYLASGNQCPSCGAGFNPKCSNHYHYYFET